MKIIALAGVVLLGSLAHAQDAVRYVVPNQSSTGPTWALWQSHAAFRACSATLYQAIAQGRGKTGVDYCADYRVGTLAPDLRVEKLDSPECRDMVRVRVLDGPLQGRTGCMADSLTSIKPEGAK